MPPEQDHSRPAVDNQADADKNTDQVEANVITLGQDEKIENKVE